MPFCVLLPCLLSHTLVLYPGMRIPSIWGVLPWHDLTWNRWGSLPWRSGLRGTCALSWVRFTLTSFSLRVLKTTPAHTTPSKLGKGFSVNLFPSYLCSGWSWIGFINMSWLFVSALSLTFASGSAFGGGGDGGMRVVRGEGELNGVAGSCPIRS